LRVRPRLEALEQVAHRALGHAEHPGGLLVRHAIEEDVHGGLALIRAREQPPQ
jgi:hypothetical protein